MKRLMWYPCRAWWWLWQSRDIWAGEESMWNWFYYLTMPAWWSFLLPFRVAGAAYRLGEQPLPKPDPVKEGALTLQTHSTGEVCLTGTARE